MAILLKSIIFVMIYINLGLTQGNDPFFRYNMQKEIIDSQYEEVRREYQQSKGLSKIKITPSKSKKNKTYTKSQGNYSHHQFLKLLKHNKIKYKYNSRFDGMHYKWASKLGRIKKVFENTPLILTSGTDGLNHKRSAKSHYTGYKIDIRVKHIDGVKIRNRKVVEGRSFIKSLIKKLNKIPGIKARFEEGVNYPHFDIALI
jgi:hypothetical protein